MFYSKRKCSSAATGAGTLALVFVCGCFSAIAQEVSTQEAPGTSSGISQAAVPSTASAPIDSEYILGPGDRLSLNFFNVPEYDGERTVAIDGSLTLPIVGKVPVAGLTVAGVSQALAIAYGQYLRTPLVTVDLASPRPFQVGISGEVSQPGAYELALGAPESSAVEWPTVVEAIQLAGGITDRADIKAVEIRRAMPSGGVETVRLDLWEILQTGSIRNDITLRNGDAIRVPTATTLTPAELTTLSAANFSPDSIQVTVVGEVPEPGTREISANAPLNQALLAAGGFDPRRADKGEVELIRLNPDGTVSQREIPVAFEEGINETTNPALRNNDVIVVGRSGQAAFADGAGAVLNPLGAILSPLRLILGIFD